MTRPLPESLRPSERNAWRGQRPRHAAHERTANPATRTVAAHDPRDERDEHNALVALIGSKYNTRRTRDLAHIAAYYGRKGYPTPEQVTATIPLLTAAEELRNRLLALETPTGKRTPQTRYHLPEQIAAHHTNPKSTRPRALDLAALAHHEADRAAYLAALAHHKADNLAELSRDTITQVLRATAELVDRLANKPTQRLAANLYDPTTKTWRNLRLTPAEAAAVSIATTLARYDEAAATTANRDRRKDNERRRKERKADQTPANGKPDEADDLSGWHDLVTAKPAREIAHLGRLGRKRTTSDTGKTPNRIANYCGDPLRRIYSRKTRGTRALVVVDCSGSMSLDESDLDAILKASAGSTVIGYSATNDDDPNTYLLAHNSRRVRHLPHWSGGNGVDGPALSWAIKHYRKHAAPVLWITDGRVTGRGDESTRDLRNQCRRIATKHNVSLAPNVRTALVDLAAIAAGRRPPQRLNILN